MPVCQHKGATYGALFALLCGLPVNAENEDAIARCARIAAVGDRILCLENALRQPHPATADTPDVMDPPVNRIPVPEPPPATDNFGLKEKRPAEETNAIQVTVTSMRTNLTNRFVFETEGGQIWLQTDQRTIRYDNVPFEAEIRAASMGSFFLRPVAGGVSVRVRREK